MKDLSVMYHYVRERGGWTGIHPLSPGLFEQQIEILTRYYEIVSPDELDKEGNKPKCILSFDDGTKDQYTVAFDILNRKGIPGYFTVMSGPLENGKIPVFHLVHTVLSMYSDKEIWEDLNKDFELIDIPKKSNYYSYEKDLLRRYNKYVFNFYLTEQQSRAFLEKKIFLKYGSKDKFIDDFYISKSEFIQMKQAGMTIGVHCVNHRPYKGEALEFYNEEIAPCARYLKDELKITPEWYTPAFGGGEHYREMMLTLEPILKMNGFKGGFTTIEGVNDGLTKFWLNRYDCIKIPPITNLNVEKLINS